MDGSFNATSNYNSNANTPSEQDVEAALPPSYPLMAPPTNEQSSDTGPPTTTRRKLTVDSDLHHFSFDFTDETAESGNDDDDMSSVFTTGNPTSNYTT